MGKSSWPGCCDWKYALTSARSLLRSSNVIVQFPIRFGAGETCETTLLFVGHLVLLSVVLVLRDISSAAKIASARVTPMACLCCCRVARAPRAAVRFASASWACPCALPRLSASDALWFPRLRLIRPISARYLGGLSLRVSERILVSRLERRSRQRRGGPSGLRQGSTEHLDCVLREEQGFNNAFQASAGRNGWGIQVWGQISRLRAGETELALQIIRSNLDVAHRHPWIRVAE